MCQGLGVPLCASAGFSAQTDKGYLAEREVGQNASDSASGMNASAKQRRRLCVVQFDRQLLYGSYSTVHSSSRMRRMPVHKAQGCSSDSADRGTHSAAPALIVRCTLEAHQFHAYPSSPQLVAPCRHQRRQVLASQSGYCHNESEPAKGRRAQLFAAWLVDKYGKVLLNAGAGVVDIAGGLGCPAVLGWAG